jgi:hypothetical protein
MHEPMIELKRTGRTIEFALSGPCQTDAVQTHCQRLGATAQLRFGAPGTYVVRATWDTTDEVRLAQILLQLAVGCGVHDHTGGTGYAAV